MPRILIAGTTENSRVQLSQLLQSAGHPVYRCCASGGEARRALTECEEAILLMAGHLPDDRPDTLLADFPGRLQILLVAKPGTFPQQAVPDLFHLAYPCPGGAVIGAVEMLIQLQRMRRPQRTLNERQQIARAKEILMHRYGMSEPQAHKHLQRYAMTHGIKLIEYAQQLIDAKPMEE